MNTVGSNPTRCVAALLLFALWALTGAAGLAPVKDVAKVAAQPVELRPLDDWTQWGPFVAPGNFDMVRCLTLQAGDANGDGLTDLICPYDYGSGLMRTFVQFSTGDGFTGWTAMHDQFLNFDLSKCRTLQSGNVDTDDLTDLICPYDNESGTNDTYVQVAEGGGTFYSPWILHQGGVFDLDTCKPLVAGANSIFFWTGLVCVRDLGNDTTRTLVQYSNGAALSQWLNGSPLGQQFNVNSCRHIRVGDFNGDGRDDLACPYDYDNSATTTFVQLSTVNYEYTGWMAWGVPMTAGSFDMKKCQGLLVGDADGNGLDDLICPYNYGGDQTRTFVQFAFETFMTQWISHHPLIQPQFNVASCRTLQAGDINGDGRVDLLCPYDYGNGATTTFVQYLNGAIHTSWQQASNLIPAGNFDMNRCRPLMAGDVNGDGRVDLICPYDYGDASTATFVQLSQDFRILLPGIFREE